MAAEEADELHALRGAKAIAQFVYGSADEDKKVYKLAERGQIPVFRLGSLICARKASILAWIEAQERNGRRTLSDPALPHRRRRRR